MMNNNIFISPVPKIWHEIHQNLMSYWTNELNGIGAKPPIPLILAGWNFSEDWEKKERWVDTLNWAEINNCKHLIPELTDEDKYFG